MNAEDQYIISNEQVYITRQGNGIVDGRHIHSDDDKIYYKVVGIETRYVIRGVSGILSIPELLYISPLNSECYFASGVCSTTRRYRRSLDRTYFKYYDDAEEVFNNIRRFIIWCKNVDKLNLKKTQLKAIKAMTQDLIKDAVATPEWERIRALQVGLPVKRRSELKPLAKDLAEELDLVKDRD